MISVLVADDHAVVRRGLVHILQDGGFQVTGQAGSAGEVLRMLRENSYDVLVLDISMPEGGGLEVLKQVQNWDDPPEILMLSVYPEKQYALRSIQQGAKGYLTKNSAPQLLVEAVRKVSRGEVYLTQQLADDLVSNLQGSQYQNTSELLSNREMQVLELFAQGNSPTQIAEKLALSVKTISTYRRRLLDKLNLNTTADLIRFALEKGIGQE